MAAKTDTFFADLVDRGLKYAITGSAAVPISDEVLREFSNRLYEKVLDGDPVAIVVWNNIAARGAKLIVREFTAAYQNDVLGDYGDPE